MPEFCRIPDDIPAEAVTSAEPARGPRVAYPIRSTGFCTMNLVKWNRAYKRQSLKLTRFARFSPGVAPVTVHRRRSTPRREVRWSPRFKKFPPCKNIILFFVGSRIRSSRSPARVACRVRCRAQIGFGAHLGTTSARRVIRERLSPRKSHLLAHCCAGSRARL